MEYWNIGTLKYWDVEVQGPNRSAAKRPNYELFGRRFRVFAKGNGTKKTPTYFDNKLRHNRIPIYLGINTPKEHGFLNLIK